MCTQMCPRNALGLGVEPHKVMRAAFTGQGSLLGDANGVFSCCDCGLCSYYACDFGLSPGRMVTRMKDALLAGGLKPEKKIKGSVTPNFAKVPTKRLMSRMGIAKFDVETQLIDRDLPIRLVRLPLKMHIGAPSEPVISKGEKVQRGQLIARIPKDSLGAQLHASISGVVSAVMDRYIEIMAEGEKV